jgi:hypothetical protein
MFLLNVQGYKKWNPKAAAERKQFVQGHDVA